MKLAVSNIGFLENDAAAVFDVMQNCGFTGLEIAPSKFIGENPYAKNAAAAQKSAALRQKYGFSIVSMQSIWFGQTGNIFMPQDTARLAAYTRRAVDFAAAVGCKSLVFGCPKNRFIPADKKAADALSFFAEICAYAAQHGVCIALEANPAVYGTNFANTSTEAFDFARLVPGLKVNYDVGTLLTNGETLEVLSENLDAVSHIHISEPSLAPIERHAVHRELAQLLQRKKYTGFVSIEMKTSPLAVIQSAIELVAKEFA